MGKDGPRVNPFSLEPNESNIKFLYSFIKLLLTNSGAELEPEDDDVIHKAVQDMYLLDPRTAACPISFPKKLDRYLSKWVGKGIYNAVFDNVEDSLSLSRLQCFDFQGVNNEQYADLIEPLMVWLLRRINDVLFNPANLGVPRHILIEEIFSSMKNKQLLEGALASINGRPLQKLRHSPGASALIRHGFVHASGSGGKEMAWLTSRGFEVHRAYEKLIHTVDTSWQRQFGKDRVAALVSPLEDARGCYVFWICLDTLLMIVLGSA